MDQKIKDSLSKILGLARVAQEKLDHLGGDVEFEGLIAISLIEQEIENNYKEIEGISWEAAHILIDEEN